MKAKPLLMLLLPAAIFVPGFLGPGAAADEPSASLASMRAGLVSDHLDTAAPMQCAWADCVGCSQYRRMCGVWSQSSMVANGSGVVTFNERAIDDITTGGDAWVAEESSGSGGSRQPDNKIDPDPTSGSDTHDEEGHYSDGYDPAGVEPIPVLGINGLMWLAAVLASTGLLALRKGRRVRGCTGLE